MHLNETPSLYRLPSGSLGCSAQTIATRWLDRSFELNNLNLVDYQRRVQELRRSVRQGIDSASTCTDGIINGLKQLIHSGWLNGRWNLVSTDCDHFASEPWEKNFACCYRNAQCILSSLFRVPEFRKRLFGSVSAMPSIWKLQALLESAWSLGFDPLGASQISATINPNKTSSGANPTGSGVGIISSDSRNLVGIVDSTACLGATDMVSLFGSIGIRSSIIECRAPSGPGGTHPYLLTHIYSYITSGNSNGIANEPVTLPMLLQHEGHSRIVIGVEVDEDEKPLALIVLDPDVSSEAMRQVIKAADYSMSNPSMDLSRLSFGSYHWMDVLGSMRVDITQLIQPQYQLLQINGLIETDLDLQDAMVPENVTVAIS
ncbi:Zinc finger with UFM1-specific peptidase domain protein isoform 2 [Schistosoma japonicum]|nr:Zinc finger-containing ubiquitin peptidase 1 [Schistosoma japonicum]TNN06051.1 Zinc finger with UFM1-specific peptidase domain protein isoform 2 [Schistosoma japonicum]